MGLTTFEFDALAREATAQEIQGGGPGGWTGGRGGGGEGGRASRQIKTSSTPPCANTIRVPQRFDCKYVFQADAHRKCLPVHRTTPDPYS